MLPVLFFLKNLPICGKISKFFLAENQQVKRKSRKKLQKILDNVVFCRIFALSNLKKQEHESDKRKLQRIAC